MILKKICNKTKFIIHKLNDKGDVNWYMKYLIKSLIEPSGHNRLNVAPKFGVSIDLRN